MFTVCILILHPQGNGGGWGGGGGGLSLFLQHLYRRDFGVKSEFWVGIGTLGGGNVFQVGLENSQYKKQYKNSIKNSEYNSQAKKKKDFDCNFYNFSLLVPYHKKSLVVCVCILILHGLYFPYPQYFFCGG